VLDPDMPKQVARRVQRRRAVRQGGLRVGDGGQRLVVDRDPRRGGAGVVVK
jgi:hypothetical protein